MWFIMKVQISHAANKEGSLKRTKHGETDAS